jgi:hypothetical protein
MDLIAISDFNGSNAVHKVSDLFASAGVTLPSPPLVKLVLFREISGGTTNSRISGANVGPTRGIPFSTAENVVLPDTASGGTLGGTAWNLDNVYVYAATGDVLSIAVALF